jgi:hypothetical protein
MGLAKNKEQAKAQAQSGENNVIQDQSKANPREDSLSNLQ